jgi:hypothetical protein
MTGFLLSAGALLLGTIVITLVHGLVAGREPLQLYVGTAIAVAVAGSALFPFPHRVPTLRCGRGTPAAPDFVPFGI